MPMLRAAGDAAGTDHLWAKAAELERDFAGYKRRLAERRAHQQHAVAAAEAAAGCRAGGGGEEERVGDAAAAAGRGRRYEEYVRKRDERLRQEWRARMERKEAEVQALWARLDRTGSRGGGRRAGDDDHDHRGGELAVAAAAATGHGRDQDQVKPPPQQKPGNLVVKVKPSTHVTPRGNPPPPPAAKLARPRTSVPSSSLAAGSPSARLSTPDPRRRPPHLHRAQPQPQPQAQSQPPAAPRKENRLPPPPPPSTAAASPATPRPRTTTILSRSRSMFKDRGCSSVGVGDSPRPPRFQPPRPSYDGAASASSNLKEPTPSPRADVAIAVVQGSSSSSSRELQAAAADRKKASAVAPEPPFLVRRPSNGVEPTSAPPVVVSKDLVPYISEITTPAGRGNGDNKSYQQERVDQSSDNKFGSEEITGDSDTEPSYVYIKKDSDEQISRPQPRSDNKEDSDSVEDDTLESTGSNEVAGESPAAADAEEEELRRESSESLYLNYTSATDSPHPSATEQSPENNTAPCWTRKSTEVMEDAEKRLPTPTTPRSSVQSPMDAVNGLKRLLTFGKRNGKASEAAPPPAAVQRATLRSVTVTPAPPAGNDGGSVSGECPASGSVAKLTVDSSEDLDNSYVISPHVGSLQSIVGPSYPASSELKEPILHAKSPRVHRSFFSFSSFKSRAN